MLYYVIAWFVKLESRPVSGGLRRGLKASETIIQCSKECQGQCGLPICRFASTADTEFSSTVRQP